MIDDYRYEIKFVLDQNELTHCLNWIKCINAKEKYSERYNNSLYFDNLENDAIYDNLIGISQRNKIRLRWYEKEDFSISNIKLEVKEKNGRLNRKNSIILPRLSDYIKKKCIKEIHKKLLSYLYMSNVEHPFLYEYLIPELIVKYKRSYFETSDNIRITFDKHIQFFNVISNLRINQLKPINYSKYIMEIKFSPDKKEDVAKLLRQTRLTPKRNSKYLTGTSITKSFLYL